jgi:hypothetical protein
MKKIVLILGLLVGANNVFAKYEGGDTKYIPLAERIEKMKNEIESDSLLKGLAIFSERGIVSINWVKKENEVTVICHVRYYNGSSKIEYYHGKKTSGSFYESTYLNIGGYSSWKWESGSSQISFESLLSGTKTKDISWMNLWAVREMVAKGDFSIIYYPTKEELQKMGKGETHYVMPNLSLIYR